MTRPIKPIGYLRRLVLPLVVTLLLAGCTIEGGVPEPTPTVPAAPLVQPTDPVVAEALAERDDTWVIGMLESPGHLSPYQPTPGAQRVAAPVTELLFPSPILAYNYGYTTTGVLERVPTIENGGAEVRKADVYLDAAGNITTTVTEVITQVDQLVVTFEWNPALRWSDGEPLTAADSVFAYEVARAAPPNNEARDRLAQTLSYEQVDEHTTRAILQPDYTGPTYFLSFWTPLPRHVLQDLSPEEIAAGTWAQQPIGYGPYAIERRSEGEIHMVRNRHYYGPEPAASKLLLALVPNHEFLRAGIANGSIDAAMTDRVPADQFAYLDQYADEGAAQVSYIPNPIWEHIDFNLDVPILQDIRFRRAIAYATNRQAMVDALFDGRTPVLDSWVLPGQPEAAPPDSITRYPYDPAQAQALLDEIGYVDTDGDGIRSAPDGVPVTLQLFTTAGNSVRERVAEMFRNDMRAIGIDVQVIALPSEQFFDPNGPLFQRQFQLALFGWGAAPNAGGLTLWSCASVPSDTNGWGGENFAGWCFRDADRAIRIAATSLDPAERYEAYVEQQRLWTQELPAVPLFQRLSLALVAAEVQGVRPDAFAPITWNIFAWRRDRG